MNRIYQLSVILVCFAALVPLACGKKQPDNPAANVAQPEVPSAPQQIRPGLWILEPVDGSSVAWRPRIFGTISDKSVTEIFPVVHAAGDDGYWVQPPAAIREDGVWGCQPYIGLADTKAGAKFEIGAFAKTTSAIAPGAKLSAWPEAGLSSNIVILIRQ